MKILLSVFAFRPNAGSEHGVGWNWALELAKEHEVVAVTDISRKEFVEAELQANPVENLTVVYFRPCFLKYAKINSLTAQLIYSLWQYSLLPFAFKLHKKHDFDLAIHLTYGVFRHPSFLGFLGVPFVFGPVGGGEDAPWTLKRSLPLIVQASELLRYILNKLALLNPMLWICLSKTKVIVAKTDQTIRALPWLFRKKAVQHHEIGIFSKHDKSRTLQFAKDENVFKVLFVGRLLGWKGCHLAIKSIAEVIRRGHAIELTIIGSGPLLTHLQQISLNEGVSKLINWIEHIPQSDLFEKYPNYDVFLFPSLHDSSGNVILEAMSFGLPIICLDIGGPATLVDNTCALVVNTKGQTERQVVNQIADKLEYLVNNPAVRLDMSKASLVKSGGLTWSATIDSAMTLIENMLSNK